MISDRATALLRNAITNELVGETNVSVVVLEDNQKKEDVISSDHNDLDKAYILIANGAAKHELVGIGSPHTDTDGYADVYVVMRKNNDTSREKFTRLKEIINDGLLYHPSFPDTFEILNITEGPGFTFKRGAFSGALLTLNYAETS